MTLYARRTPAGAMILSLPRTSCVMSLLAAAATGASPLSVGHARTTSATPSTTTLTISFNLLYCIL